MENLKRRLDNQINGDCSLEALQALQTRARKQVQAGKARKKHGAIGSNTIDKGGEV
jgi:hypothetical protein